MSYAEPLITIALIALALIFNRPIGNALLMIGDPAVSCPELGRCKVANFAIARCEHGPPFAQP